MFGTNSDAANSQINVLRLKKVIYMICNFGKVWKLNECYTKTESIFVWNDTHCSKNCSEILMLLVANERMSWCFRYSDLHYTLNRFSCTVCLSQSNIKWKQIWHITQARSCLVYDCYKYYTYKTSRLVCRKLVLLCICSLCLLVCLHVWTLDYYFIHSVDADVWVSLTITWCTFKSNNTLLNTLSLFTTVHVRIICEQLTLFI
mgnify:CR=1 FL=1